LCGASSHKAYVYCATSGAIFIPTNNLESNGDSTSIACGDGSSGAFGFTVSASATPNKWNNRNNVTKARTGSLGIFPLAGGRWDAGAGEDGIVLIASLQEGVRPSQRPPRWSASTAAIGRLESAFCALRRPHRLHSAHRQRAGHRRYIPHATLSV